MNVFEHNGEFLIPVERNLFAALNSIDFKPWVRACESINATYSWAFLYRAEHSVLVMVIKDKETAALMAMIDLEFSIVEFVLLDQIEKTFKYLLNGCKRIDFDNNISHWTIWDDEIKALIAAAVLRTPLGTS